VDSNTDVKGKVPTESDVDKVQHLQVSKQLMLITRPKIQYLVEFQKKADGDVDVDANAKMHEHEVYIDV